MAKKLNVRKLPERGRPHATELFTTTISHLTRAPITTYPSFEPNYSPAPQITAQFGDLIAPKCENSQANRNIATRIIHHTPPTPGEYCASSHPGGRITFHRPLRSHFS